MIQTANKISDILSPHQITDVNVFMSDVYKQYSTSAVSSVIYVYSAKHVMPVQIVRKAFFKYAIFIDEPYCYDSTVCETEKEFLNQTCSFLKTNLGIQWLNSTPAYAFFMSYPIGSKYIPFGSHVVDLSLSEDVLFANVHSKHRNVIKKAQKDGVIIECGRTDKMISDYYQMDVATWARSAKGSSGESSIRNQVEKMGDKAIIYMAYLDGEPQSGAIYYFNEQMCYYMHGVNKNNPHIGSGNFLQWQAMLDMKARGVQKFSFVGCRINEDENSKYHGIQRFKERFGGSVVQGYMFKVTLNPVVYGLSRFMTRFLNLKRIGKFVPNTDTIDAEIHKWPQK